MCPSLENTGPSGPAADIALQERGELVSDRREFPSEMSNLMKIQSHPGIDQTTCDYLSVPARRQAKRGNYGDPFSRLDKSNLCVNKVHNHGGLREHAGLPKMFVDELLPHSGRWDSNQPLAFQRRPC